MNDTQTRRTRAHAFLRWSGYVAVIGCVCAIVGILGPSAMLAVGFLALAAAAVLLILAVGVRIL